MRWPRAMYTLCFLFLLFPMSRASAASPAPGTLVSTVTFSHDCGIGVGIAFDGSNLWYSCHATSPDLFRADPTTGNVTASYTIAGGLGALAYDSTRNAIWAAPGGTPGNVYLIQLDSSQSVTSSKVAFTATNVGLVDGLAYENQTDTLYYSPDDQPTIYHYSSGGQLLN